MAEPLTFEPWVARASRLHGGACAVDAPDRTLTYCELDTASAALAHELATIGVTPGDEVALSLPSGAAFAVALHACLRSGFVAVPDDLRLPLAQREGRLVGCAATVDTARAAAHFPPESVLPPVAPPWTDDAPTGDPSPNRWCAPIAGSGDDAATQAVRITTSGTTGPGTPVHLSRGAFLWNALGSAAALGQPADERWLSAMPVAHVGGLTVLIRSAIAGTTAVLRPRFDLDEQVALLQAGEATITSVVPTTLSRLLDAGLDHPPNLRLVLLGGAPIPPELLARAEAAGVPVASTYGLSEACSQVLTRGRPLFCTRVVLRSELGPAGATAGGVQATTASTDLPAAPAEPFAAADDEVLVKGPTLAGGVAGTGGWLATGDRGRRNPDGSIAIVGRLAETIVTGGENVAPTEVEAQLVAQAAVADAAALGVEHPEWGEQVEARVVLAPGQTLDEAALIAALRGVLPPYAVPKRITAVDTLPRTPTGKLIRRELR
jgi:O-succinylbenzoic acid--CoA ligase